MLDPEGTIRAALQELAEADAAALAPELADIAAHHRIPLTAVLAWIHDRPRPPLLSPREFLRWTQRYHITTAADVEIHLRPATNDAEALRRPQEGVR
jgi:hypothetical protein